MRRADALVRRKMPLLRRGASGRNPDDGDRSSPLDALLAATRRSPRRAAVFPNGNARNDARNDDPRKNARNAPPTRTFSTVPRLSARRRRLAFRLLSGDGERYPSSRSRRSLRARNRRRTFRLPPLRAFRRLFFHPRASRRPSSELSRSDVRNRKSAPNARRRARRLRGVPLRVRLLRSIARGRRA